jgi:hypothetical protein
LNNERGKMETTHLIIPGATAPRALRRVLAILIDDLGAPPDQRKRRAYIEDAENQILTKNIEFYEDLRAYLTTYESEQHRQIREMAIAVAERQLALLSEYKDRIRRLDRPASGYTFNVRHGFSGQKA